MARKALKNDEVFVWTYSEDENDEQPTRIHTTRLSGEHWYKFRGMRTDVSKRGKIKFKDFEADMWALRQCVIKIENIYDQDGKFLEVVDDKNKAIDLITHVDDKDWFQAYLNFITLQEEREANEEEMGK